MYVSRFADNGGAMARRGVEYDAIWGDRDET